MSECICGLMAGVCVCVCVCVSVLKCYDELNIELNKPIHTQINTPNTREHRETCLSLSLSLSPTHTHARYRLIVSETFRAIIGTFINEGKLPHVSRQKCFSPSLSWKRYIEKRENKKIQVNVNGMQGKSKCESCKNESGCYEVARVFWTRCELMCQTHF